MTGRFRHARPASWSTPALGRAGIPGSPAFRCGRAAVVDRRRGINGVRDLAPIALAESEENRRQTEVANADAKAELGPPIWIRPGRFIPAGKRDSESRGCAVREALRLSVPLGRSLAELRTEAIACLLLSDIEVWKEWEIRPDQPRGFAIDESFERYACGDKDGNVSVRRLADDHELCSLPGSGLMHDWCLDFSSDGQILLHLCLVSGGYHSRIWRLDGRGRCLCTKTTAC